jgi:TonB family protein
VSAVHPGHSTDQDPFQQMLVWSAGMHVAVFLLMGAVSMYGPKESLLPQPAIAWVVPGIPGPSQGMGGGSPTPADAPAPTPDKEEPRVVRPTKEDRDQLPMPDAKERKRKPKPKQPHSGLTGRDSASAASAKLKSQASGSPGLGLGGAGGGSAFDQDFEYAYYVQQMLGRISQHWQRAPVRGTAVTIIRFTILKDGRLQDVQVEKSCGVALLDRAAHRAVFLSDPLPPLPNSYPRDQVGVHLRFEYSDQS